MKNESGNLTVLESRQVEADALAARFFPAEWSKVEGAPGRSKARQKLRRAAREAVRIQELIAGGSKCANCASFNTRPIHGLKMMAHCDWQSDFHGYVEAKPDGLCLRWLPSSSPSVTKGVSPPTTPTPQAENGNESR